MKRKMAVVVRYYSDTNSGEVRAVFDTLDDARQFIIENTENLPEGTEYYIYYGMYDALEESDCKGQ